MEITYDPEKNEVNIARRGLSFERVHECDWSDPFVIDDKRFDYGEIRKNAFVPLNDRLHCVTFTRRDGKMRIISFRKANSREQKRYDKEK